MITASFSLLSTYTRRNTILYLLLTLHYTHHTHKSTTMCVCVLCLYVIEFVWWKLCILTNTFIHVFRTYTMCCTGGSSLRLRKICLMALYLTAQCLKFRLSKAKITKYIND